MHIKEVAELTGVSSYTLRYYEKIGLILHVAKNSSGHRDYSEQDVAWIGFLQRLKATGMSLVDMKKFAELRANGDKTIPTRLALLEKHKQKMEANIKELQENLGKITAKLAFYNNTQR